MPLIFEGPQGRSGLSLCTQSNMRSLATQLKRLKQQMSLRRLDRLVLVRESRVPLSPTAKVARQTLEELEQQQAVIIFPAVEALAALDALRELLSDAKSGDLACQGQAVSPQSVEEWLSAHLSASVLRDFVDDVLRKSASSAINMSEASALEPGFVWTKVHPTKIHSLGGRFDYSRSSSRRCARSKSSSSSSLNPKWWANSWITVARMFLSKAPRVRLTCSIGRRKILTTFGDRSP